MKIKFFTIPINTAEDFEKEVNAFLSNHKIVENEKHLIQSAGQAYWCIYISYIEQGKTVYTKSKGDPIDYMKILPEKERIKYQQLKTVRKEIAKEDAVSAFVVATNAELAEIAKLETITVAGMKKISGFGEKKAEKYAKKIIDKMKRYETQGKSDK